MLACLALTLSLLSSLAAETNIFPPFQTQTARDYLQTVSKLVEREAPDSPEVLFLNAQLENQLGQKPEAEKLARSALQRSPNRTDIHVFLADMLVRQDRLEEAAVLLRQSLQFNPPPPGAYRRLGMILEREGKLKEAEGAFRSAIQLNPRDTLAHILLGRLLSGQGLTAQAKAEFMEACRLNPNDPRAFYGLFQAQMKLGDSDSAQASLKSFRRLKLEEKSILDEEDIRNESPQDLGSFAAEFHAGVAGYLLRQGREDLAEAHLLQALKLSPENRQGLSILSVYYLRKQRLQEAKSLLEKLVQVAPNDVAARVNLGSLLLQLKEPAPAVIELQKALELDPRQPQALFHLSRFYLTTHQELPQALALSRKLVDIQPSAVNYDLLGWAYYANGQTNEALQASAQAVQKEPTNSTYQLRYDRLKQSAGSPP